MNLNKWKISAASSGNLRGNQDNCQSGRTYYLRPNKNYLCRLKENNLSEKDKEYIAAQLIQNKPQTVPDNPTNSFSV